jgi:branched-chain amino acid transport system substrate-binding protein
MCYVDETFGSESADAFEAGLAKNSGRATTRVAAPSGGDWTKLVGTIQAQPTRNVFAAFHTDDAEGFLTEWDKQGMRAAGYTLYGPGLLTEQAVLTQTHAASEGSITAYFWSTELDNPENKALLDLFPREYTDDETGAPVGLNGYAVEMWDAMTALNAALTRTNGETRDPDALIAALEGLAFNSPRGAFAFDKATHNPVQDIYIREVRSVNGNPVNAIRDRLPSVTDPGA